LFRIEDNGEEGFIDSTGKVVITPKFAWVGDFNDGLAVAGNDTSYGYIDEQGKLVIPYKFDLDSYPLSLYSLKKVPNELRSAINEASFADGLALFFDAIKKRYGYINTKGEVVIEPIFLNATRFKQGYAVVMTSIDNSNWENTRLGVIDIKGKIVIQDKYYKLSRLSDNFLTATLATKKGESYYFSSIVLNNKGNVVNTLIPGQIGLFGEFSNGYSYGSNALLHQLTGKGYFIYDSTGKTLNNPDNDETLYFEDVRINKGKFFWIKRDNKYSWFTLHNKNMKIVDLKVYDTIKGGFDVNGIACVKYHNPQTNKSLFGYIDTLGNFILEPKFDNASNFRNGLAIASLTSGELIIIGYINKKGEFVWSKEIR